MKLKSFSLTFETLIFLIPKNSLQLPLAHLLSLEHINSSDCPFF